VILPSLPKEELYLGKQVPGPSTCRGRCKNPQSTGLKFPTP
jgi:hypothetical protein